MAHKKPSTLDGFLCILTYKMQQLTRAEKKHIETIWSYYKNNKRDLPWRHTTDVYRILVSELMLQQTQVSRVLIKYKEFIDVFPNFKTLAKASNTDVLKVWKGLGYNRRAFFLKRIAEALIDMPIQDIQNPKILTYEKLLKLPGIGQSTAGAIMAFSHNIGMPFIETNIRTIYLAHFFSKRDKEKPVSDTEIYQKIAKILSFIPRKKYRDWYYALYDYGSMLKATKKHDMHILSQKSKLYKKQSTFVGSNRQLRAFILHTITASMPDGLTEQDLQSAITKYIRAPHSPFTKLSNPEEIIKKILNQMITEGQIALRPITKPAKQIGKNQKRWYIS